MKSRLYLETTIPSYLTGRPSRDLIIAGHQQITKDWWEVRRDDFAMYVSQLVIDEVSAGDVEAARERVMLLQAFPVLSINDEVLTLAERFLSSGRCRGKRGLTRRI